MSTPDWSIVWQSETRIMPRRKVLLFPAAQICRLLRLKKANDASLARVFRPPMSESSEPAAKVARVMRRTAVVTGASSGIGEAVCRLLLQNVSECAEFVAVHSTCLLPVCHAHLRSMFVDNRANSFTCLHISESHFAIAAMTTRDIPCDRVCLFMASRALRCTD